MTTKLDILNYMLNVVGETPVSSAASTHPTAQSALIVLDRINKEAQTRGWWFNKEFNLTLTPDTNGYVILPSNTLKVDPVASDSNFVRRGARLYDPVMHTFNLAQKVAVNIVVQLDVEDLPETAAQFIMHKCAYDFYVNDDGDDTKANRLAQEVARAWQALNQEQLQASDVNAINRPQAALLRSGIQQFGNSYSGNPLLPGGR